jgi:hypothetical protein
MTDNEFKEWKAHHVTTEFFNHLKKSIVESQEAWANRQFQTESENQFALGGVYAVNQILDLDYEDIKGI